MPTVLRFGPYRFFFYSADGAEPPHIHAERDSAQVKYWLDPVRLESSRGFSASELRTIASLVSAHRDKLLEAWNDYFGP